MIEELTAVSVFTASLLWGFWGVYGAGVLYSRRKAKKLREDC